MLFQNFNYVVKLTMFFTSYQKLNRKKYNLHKTTKGTTRVPEISQLRAGNNSDSNGKGENNADQQACTCSGVGACVAAPGFC